MKQMCRVWLFAVLTVIGWGAVFAAQSPQQMVEETANKLMATLKKEKPTLEQDPGRIYDLVNEIVLPHFDFERMAKRVLGKHWRGATAAERQKFTDEFRTLLVRTYANSLTEYTDRSIGYLPYRDSANAEDAVVRSEVELPGLSPVAIDYRLAFDGKDWKVYDVTIDNISLVTNYRSSFSNEISSGGLTSLITTLADRNRQATCHD